MRIFPAIDLRGGEAVRLTQGDYSQTTVYSSDPIYVAKSFSMQGASCLHVVDLDGAKDGALSNFATIAEIIKTSGMFCEVGGGIRDEARVEAYLQAGAGRVILGSAAVERYEFVEAMVKKYGARVAVGVDAREGKVAIHGWQRVTDVDSFAFCQKLCDSGVQAVIYTDVARDGMLKGTNLAAYERLRAIEGLEIVASGGVAFEQDITALRELGIDAAIIGKALYTGALDLKRALQLAAEEGGSASC